MERGSNMRRFIFAGILAAAVVFTAWAAGVKYVGTFVGDGAGLTNLAASSMSPAPWTNSQWAVIGSTKTVFDGTNVNANGLNTKIDIFRDTDTDYLRMRAAGRQVGVDIDEDSTFYLTAARASLIVESPGPGNAAGFEITTNSTIFTGPVAGTFYGDGLGLSNLLNNMFKIVGGDPTITNGNTTVSVSDAVSMFNVQNTGGGTFTLLSAGGMIWTGAATGNASGATNIPLTGLQRMPLTNNQVGVTLTGTFSGNGNGMTNIPLSGLQQLPITNNQTGVTLTGTFSGNGNGLTNMNGTNSLNAGTVWYSRLGADAITQPNTNQFQATTLANSNISLSIMASANVTNPVIWGSFNASGATNIPVANIVPVPITNFQQSLSLTGNWNGTFTANPPMWRDQISAPTTLSKGGTAVARVALTNGSIITVDGWFNDSYGDGEAQFNHDMATTNANLPNLYVIPHVHLSVTNIAAGVSNTAWALIYNWTTLNGNFISAVNGAMTNTFTMTAANTLYYFPFTAITNNAAAGTVSSIFTYRLQRVAAATGDFAGEATRLHDFDIHYPVSRIGSTTSSAF